MAAYALPFVRVSVSEPLCRAEVEKPCCNSTVGMEGWVYLVAAML